MAVLRKRRNGLFSFNGLDIIPQPDSTRLWRGIMARARRTNTEIEIRQWIDEGRGDRYWYGTMWTGKPGARTLSSTKQTIVSYKTIQNLNIVDADALTVTTTSLRNGQLKICCNKSKFILTLILHSPASIFASNYHAQWKKEAGIIRI